MVKAHHSGSDRFSFSSKGARGSKLFGHRYEFKEVPKYISTRPKAVVLMIVLKDYFHKRQYGRV